jgi:hypothetical protein
MFVIAKAAEFAVRPIAASEINSVNDPRRRAAE